MRLSWLNARKELNEKRNSKANLAIWHNNCSVKLNLLVFNKLLYICGAFCWDVVCCAVGRGSACWRRVYRRETFRTYRPSTYLFTDLQPDSGTNFCGSEHLYTQSSCCSAAVQHKLAEFPDGVRTRWHTIPQVLWRHSMVSHINTANIRGEFLQENCIFQHNSE